MHDLIERLVTASTCNGGECVLLLPCGAPDCPWTMADQPYGVLASDANEWEQANAVAEITPDGPIWRDQQ